MERVRATGAVIEVCPTSNLRIGGIGDPAHHPVHRFLEAGLPVVVASDDPGIFDTTLADELDWVVRAAGLDAEAARALWMRAWDARSEVVSGRAAT
jgi:adenosine deaminase